MEEIRFIESLKVIGGEFANIELHQERIDITSKAFGISKRLNLRDLVAQCEFQALINERNILTQKCRIVYSNNSYSVDISDYKPRKIDSLKLVFDNDIDYSFKFEDRKRIEKLYNQSKKCSDIKSESSDISKECSDIKSECSDISKECSDILIVKNGLITDTSYSNIVLFDGKDYFTPNSYLLNGTMRQYLLRKGVIKEKLIGVKDLKLYQNLFIINALNSIEDKISISINNIIPLEN
jgi:4-amino-4-deoxychorismate lyase